MGDADARGFDRDCVRGSLGGLLCSDPTPKLTKDEEQLLDAMMYLFTGIEDNTKDGTELMPWRRGVKGRSVEFSRIGGNGIGFSDDELNRKTRPSRYVRYLRQIGLEEPCVFRFQETTEFSKGDSQEDFSAYSMTSNGYTFDLANAHHFDFARDDPPETKLLIELAGPRVVCDGSGYCENSWNSFLSGMDWNRFHGGLDEAKRRRGAMNLIKKACPGKPY